MINNENKPEIHEIIRKRWSPYAMERRPVSSEDLHAVFEAARWAPSSYNEQPWRYIVAPMDDPEEFDRLLSCLVESNQLWARNASVLALGITRNSFSANQKPNPFARHDLGLASAHLTFEATNRGMVAHQMGGILPEKARDLYSIPDGFEAVTGLAIGYPAPACDQGDPLRERDARPRTRRPLAQTVFRGSWMGPAIAEEAQD